MGPTPKRTALPRGAGAWKVRKDLETGLLGDEI